jgi:hypothetical protein
VNYKISLLVVTSKDSIVIICKVDLENFAFEVIVNLMENIYIEQLGFLIDLVDIVDVLFLVTNYINWVDLSNGLTTNNYQVKTQ